MRNDLLNNEKVIIDRFGTDYLYNKNDTKPHMVYNCPFCLSKRGKADDDHKLYVSMLNLKFYCFKCHSKGTIRSFDVSADNSHIIYNKLLSMYDNDTDEDEEDNMFYIKDIKIPKDTKAYEYLIGRGIDDEKIDYYNIRFGTDELFGRIIVPNIMYSKNWTDMYQARSYINQIPKYVNPEGANKSQSVFNLHRLGKGGEVYVVEGAITAICGGRDCIGLYGSSPSEKQLTDIISHEFEEINCVLDYDESGIKGNQRLAEELRLRCSSRTKINIINMPPGVDAADLGESKFKRYVHNNKIEYISKNNVYANLLQLRKDGK